MKITTFFLSILLTISAFAQTPKEVTDRIAPNSATIIEKSLKMYELKKYKEAAAELSKVPETDTNYYASVLQAAAYLLDDSLYDKSLEVLSKVKDKLFPAKSFYYTLSASNYKRKKEYDKAIEVLNEGIKFAPANHLLYYNLGLVYEDMKKWQEAYDTYKKALYLSPTHSSSNTRMGVICAKAGLIPESMLALNMAILANPSEAISILSFMEQASMDKIDVEYSISEPYPSTQFEDIKLILVNKVALSKGYKLNAKIDFSVVRQTQALFEKLSYEKNNPNFFNQTYVRIFEKVFKQNLYNGYVGYVFSQVTEPSLSKEVRKYQDDAAKFKTWLVNNLESSFSEQLVVTAAGKEILFHDYNNNFRLRGVGKADATKREEGVWTIYNDNGTIRTKSKFQGGLKDGLWVYYHTNTRIADSTTWKADKKTGESVLFDEEGFLTQKLPYTNDQLNGAVKNYFPSGALKNTIDFKNDVRSGKIVIYYPNGSIEKEIEIANGNYEGTYKDYYINGKLYESSTYKADNINGKSTRYFMNGNKMAEREYLNGKAVGTWVTYHMNGKTKSKGSYTNNMQVGKWEFFNTDGILTSEIILDESGKLNGVVKEYNDEGVLIIEKFYSKGDLQSYKCYNKQGKQIKEVKKEGGKIRYIEVNDDGKTTEEGDYVNGKKEGIWKTYYFNGKLRESTTYKNDLMEGPYKSYYSSGKIQSEVTYKNDEKEGLFKSYHKNGNVDEYRFYIDGKLNGFVEEYSQTGKLESKSYWINGVIQGPVVHYFPNGKIESIENYHDDEFIYRVDLDTTGKEIYNSTHTGVDYTLKSYSVTGKELMKSSYHGHVKEGKTEFYFGNGQLKEASVYVNGEINGERVTYGATGILRGRSNYYYGDMHGAYEAYYNTGELEEKGEYLNGYKEGVFTEYFRNGKVAVTREFKNGSLNGRSTYYTPEGDIYRIFNFEKGVLTSYSYMGKDGKEVAPIKVVNRGAFQIITYFQNGNKAFELNLMDGLWEGKVSCWYADGKIWKEMEFAQDDYSGRYVEYHKNGKIFIEDNYLFEENEGLSQQLDENGKVITQYNYVNDQIHGDAIMFRNNKLYKFNYYYGQIIKVY